MKSEKTVHLSEAEIKEVRRCASAKLGECRKTNDVIGTQIFSILGKYARVIYYPLGKDAPWGFTHVDESLADSSRPFVAINTSISVDRQVFAAAHELYHIWFDPNGEKEQMARRFAAEFLIDALILKQEMITYNIDEKNITVKDILHLCDLFVVPYHTMVKRLVETEVINNETANQFNSYTEEQISVFRKRYSFKESAGAENVQIDNLIELSVAAYEKKQITYEKLEYLLDMSGIKPADVGIEESKPYIFPSDDELDSIMEE